MSSQAAAQSRNALCHCGSGKRFKHCHGAGAGTAPAPAAVPMYPGWEAFSPEQRAELWQKMQRALAAQIEHRYDVAGRLYEEVVALAPLTFDAVHMLGAVWLMEQKFDAAESMLTRARELAPDNPQVQHNLLILAAHRMSHVGLFSLRSTVAAEMLNLLGTRWPGDSQDGSPPFGTASTASAQAPAHVVIPGKLVTAGSNRTGLLLARRFGAQATLWSGPAGDPALAALHGSRAFDAETAGPDGGRLFVFGFDADVLTWLPESAARFDSIVIALDAHDPVNLLYLLSNMEPATLRRVRLVARSAGVLAELGLPGTVDPMLFGGDGDADATARLAAPLRNSLLPQSPERLPDEQLERQPRQLRVGVFIPPLRDFEDAERWRMVEWLREQGVFIRMLEPGRLPSPHRPNVLEHLIGLATEWEGWSEGLDALFFWGAEGRFRQFDRLVFEAAAAGMAIVADGFGDFGATLAPRPDCAQFFDADDARRCMRELIARAGATRPEMQS